MTLVTPRAKNAALILLAMTQFVIVIDAAIVNVALPSIGAHLHFSRTDLSWVVNAYTLTFGGFMLLGGRLADLFGRDFQNLIPILDTLGKHFDETKVRAEALGLIFSGKSAAQARLFMLTTSMRPSMSWRASLSSRYATSTSR